MTRTERRRCAGRARPAAAERDAGPLPAGPRAVRRARAAHRHQRSGRHRAAAAMRESGVLRQVSPIFDTKALGYSTSLVAMRVPEERLQAAADIVNAHPGVSHNYRRTHEFNMWFTIAVPPGSDLQAHVDALHRLAGAESTRMLPTLRLFKIGVTLDMTGERADRPPLGAAVHARAARSRRRAHAHAARHRRDPRGAGRPGARAGSVRRAGARARHRRVDGLIDELARPAAARLPAALRRDPAAPQGRLRRQRHGRLERARRRHRSTWARRWPATRRSATATSGPCTRTGSTTSSR